MNNFDDAHWAADSARAEAFSRWLSLSPLERAKEALRALTVEELASLVPGAESDRYQPSVEVLHTSPLGLAMFRCGWSKDMALDAYEREHALLVRRLAWITERTAMPIMFPVK